MFVFYFYVFVVLVFMQLCGVVIVIFQRVIVGEVGFFIMFYKVNFIDFENSEGNLGLVNVVMVYLSLKFLIFCWQVFMNFLCEIFFE